MTKKLFVLTSIIFFIANTQAQISISTARSMTIGSTVTVTGIVTNGSELGAIRYFQDGTAGLAAYSTSMSTVKRGDSIVVTGVLKDYNNLLELDPVNSFTVVSSGHALPQNQIITPSLMNEDYEAELVRINNVNFTTNPGGTFSSNQTYFFTSGGETGQMYVRSGHPLIGHIIPTSPVALIGIASQYSTNYQLLCRDTNDILSSSSINITSPVKAENISNTGMDIKWTTNIAGTSEIMYGNTPALELGYLSGTGGSISHTVSITGASPSELFYVKAFSVNNNDTASSITNVFITSSLSSGDIKVYFTCAVDTTAATGSIKAIQLDNAVDDTVIAYINRAKYTIDIAIYNFSTQSISNISTALNDAFSRGVIIRIVYDGSSTNSGISSLNAGIGVIASPTGMNWGIMHNKFMIIDANSTDPDDPVVWTGSTNWTSNNINTDANNVVIIQDKSLAIAYTLEFEEMFGSAGTAPNLTAAKFGADKTNNTPHQFVIGGIPVECFFSPSDGTNDQILNTINSGDSDIEVFTMLISRSDIAYLLSDKKNDGLDVKVIVNSTGECSALVVSTLQSALDSNFKTFAESGILHSKYMIADHSSTTSDPLVLTGSHNWSNSANNSNDENTLIIHSAEIADIYYQDFIKHFTTGIIPPPQSISEQTYNENIKITAYPNPANKFINITLSDPVKYDCNIYLYDITGSILKSSGLSKGSYSVALNIEDINKGIYFIKLSDASYKAIKVIIQ